MACERQLGFDPVQMKILALEAATNGRLTTPGGVVYRRCNNFHRYYNCNWLLAQEDAENLCFSCRMNELIPALDRPDNLKLWTRMEEAKRRLLYSLLSFELPLTGDNAMRFRFLEDQGRNPDVFEQFVTTGRLNNTITINIAEADDAARHAAREQMNELYRTVLGHLRHESGHFYFGQLTGNPDVLAECRDLFGDERSDYAGALQSYYENGPPADWPENFVSAYASSHPAEDFAETFAHFLLITDALESAQGGLTVGTGHARDSAGEIAAMGRFSNEDWIEAWIGLAITLNEISRSLGSDDPYPFLLPDPVKRKLRFIDRLVRQQGERLGGRTAVPAVGQRPV
jgi:hypothetical protein